jgi:hypothetical protein
MKGSAAVSGNVQKTTQNNNTNIDAVSQGRTSDIWDAAQGAGNAGPGPLLTGAAGYNTGAQGAGQTGLMALAGDTNAAKTLMNPYQQGVIDQNNIGWNKINAQTVNRTNDLATRAGAFGGSRHGVAEGVALGNNAQQQAQQTAGLLNTGFDNSMNRAGQLAQFGAQGANANSNLGFAGVGNPDMWRLQMLKQGYLGPQGQQSAGAQTTFGGSFENRGSIGF